jgi:hypothetical protein
VPKLAVFPLGAFQLVCRVGRNAGPLPTFNFNLLEPAMQRLRVQPILAAVDVTAAQRDRCSVA